MGCSVPKTACFVAALLLGAVTPASAATLLLDGAGKLIGADGVDVDGTLYDVRFSGGSCADVFDGCDSPNDFGWPDAPGTNTPDRGIARSAASALLAKVFIDGALGNFDSDPSLTVGCDGTSDCRVLVPYDIADQPGEFRTFSVINAAEEAGDDVRLSRETVILFEESNLLQARFTPTEAAPIPLPAGLPLVLTGLGAFAAIRMRRSRKA